MNVAPSGSMIGRPPVLRVLAAFLLAPLLPAVLAAANIVPRASIIAGTFVFLATSVVLFAPVYLLLLRLRRLSLGWICIGAMVSGCLLAILTLFWVAIWIAGPKDGSLVNWGLVFGRTVGMPALPLVAGAGGAGMGLIAGVTFWLIAVARWSYVFGGGR